MVDVASNCTFNHAMKSERAINTSELTGLQPIEDEPAQKINDNFLKSLKSADWWIWEIICLFISGGALIAIVIFLSSINNKPQPSWAIGDSHCVEIPGSDKTVCRRSAGISVNSVVSWLGTLARLCLFVPLANSLGQLKWAWVSGKSRPLLDLDAFDSASRGVTGSVQLIWRLKAR